MALLALKKLFILIFSHKLGALSIVIAEGPQKGIITSSENAAHYYQLIEASKAVRESQADNVLYIYTDIGLYLMDDARMGSFSSWISSMHPEHDMAKLQHFWALYPDRIPDIIFLGNSAEMLTLIMDSIPGHWTVSNTNSGYILTPEP